jgi:hypothetical protein
MFVLSTRVVVFNCMHCALVLDHDSFSMQDGGGDILRFMVLVMTSRTICGSINDEEE